jgi:hypothetical protein
MKHDRHIAKREAATLEAPVREARNLAGRLGLDPYPVRYWVVDPSQSDADISQRGIVKKFVSPSAPIIFTLSGQLHHEEGKKILADADLGFLKNRIVMEVNFDNLDAHKRNLVFSSTRGQAAEGEEYAHVRNKLQQTFESDKPLQDLADYYEEQVRKGSETDDDATDELGNLMQSMDIGGDTEGDDLPGADGDNTDDDYSGNETPEEREPYEPEPVDPLHDEPDRLDIVNQDDPIHVRQGGTFTAHLEVDAIDKFDRRPGVEYEVIPSRDAGVALTETHQSALESGHKYITFAVDEDVDIGATGQLSVRVTWGDGETRSDTRDLVIAEPIEQSPTKQSQGAKPPKVVGIGEVGDGPFSYGDESVVEYVPKDGEQDIVYVAMYNKHVQKVLENVNHSENNYKRYTRLYKAHMAFYAVQREAQLTDEEAESQSEEARNAELNWFANTLIHSIAKEVDPSELI